MLSCLGHSKKLILNNEMMEDKADKVMTIIAMMIVELKMEVIIIMIIMMMLMMMMQIMIMVMTMMMIMIIVIMMIMIMIIMMMLALLYCMLFFSEIFAQLKFSFD